MRLLTSLNDLLGILGMLLMPLYAGDYMLATVRVVASSVVGLTITTPWSKALWYKLSAFCRARAKAGSISMSINAKSRLRSP